ncbi:23S rRNA (guanosine(2251)-2'-O)-methyltransferase RlmB [Alteromonas sp. KUL49]|uniref:23S rRNA (guanosine(2251)-2'-O)-methyltransferase RlmB n=1 Tax=Alteromonas sp. KUL49 TaxID=2480798 RepID=UPI00102F2295|nr:23S rRNA (guanosine(2251)-2'-O)-methyltransferase RlmB [Alteromonas sp. KUL49]TAP37918.1 23S rRNA (guanosine(2251)-2'-O)-methyltransferase RlmB [Alteromonas sp. KUL49]GEA12779.1 23S rRNA (guanosine-2'-O-)-methyltransferase RlmB [Alteromonas sp. KUL49]
MAQQEWLYGLHAMQAVLENEPERVLEVMVLKGRNDDRLVNVVNQARKNGISVQFCARKTLDDKVNGEQHQGVVARAKPARALTENDLDRILENTNQPLLLVLDGVTDPHNLGACLRNADGAGVDAVIVPKDKSAGLTATARKVACGAAEVVPLIQVTNLARTLKELQNQGVWIIGTAGETDKTLYDVSLTGPIALVMGAEGKGMRRLTKETCDELVKLPMAGSVTSLNVSVATGICLYEIVRQRLG